MGEKEHPADPGKRPWQSGDDDEGLAPGLKVDDEKQIDQSDGESQPSEQTDERGMHRRNLATGHEKAAFGKLNRCPICNLLYLRSDRTKIATLHARIDVDDWLHVVVA